jgi:predicted nucleic acid-binding protein
VIAVEIVDHPFHCPADALLQALLDDGHDFALAPQTLAKFIHIVTDSRRMPQPLTVVEAIVHAEHWWQSAEVVHVFPDARSVSYFVDWLRRHRIGRKRLLDTLLAATFRSAEVSTIITNNARDFALLGGFRIVEYR